MPRGSPPWFPRVLSFVNPLFIALRQPEYLHVLLNPLPIYGLSMGVLALAIGLAMRSRPAVVVGLAVVLVCAAAAWPVYALGHQAYEIVNAQADVDGAAWLGAHKARAEKLVWTFYVLALLAACAIGVPRRWPKSGLPLALATLLTAVAVLGAGGWIAYTGGKVQHREFRFGPAPVVAPIEDR